MGVHDVVCACDCVLSRVIRVLIICALLKGSVSVRFFDLIELGGMGIMNTTYNIHMPLKLRDKVVVALNDRLERL